MKIKKCCQIIGQAAAGSAGPVPTPVIKRRRRDSFATATAADTETSLVCILTTFVWMLARCIVYSSHSGWLGSRVVSVLDSGAVGPGSNHSRDAVG